MPCARLQDASKVGAVAHHGGSNAVDGDIEAVEVVESRRWLGEPRFTLDDVPVAHGGEAHRANGPACRVGGLHIECDEVQAHRTTAGSSRRSGPSIADIQGRAMRWSSTSSQQAQSALIQCAMSSARFSVSAAADAR